MRRLVLTLAVAAAILIAGALVPDRTGSAIFDGNPSHHAIDPFRLA